MMSASAVTAAWSAVPAVVAAAPAVMTAMPVRSPGPASIRGSAGVAMGAPPRRFAYAPGIAVGEGLTR